MITAAFLIAITKTLKLFKKNGDKGQPKKAHKSFAEKMKNKFLGK